MQVDEAGFGLFAVKEFVANQIIGEYYGDRVYCKDGKLPSNDRIVGLPAGVEGQKKGHLSGRSKFLYILGSNACFATYAQDGASRTVVQSAGAGVGASSIDHESGNAEVGLVNTVVRCNVNSELEEFIEATGVIKVRLKAKKNIRAGQEIFIDYGDSYWTVPLKIPGSRDLRCRPVWAMKEEFLMTMDAVTTAWKEKAEKVAVQSLTALGATVDGGNCDSRNSSSDCSSSGNDDDDSSSSDSGSSSDGSGSGSSSGNDENQDNCW